jgi:cytochrome c553
MACSRLAPILLLLVALLMHNDALAGEETNEEFFERRIRPLLVQHCYSCHGKGQTKGGLSLEHRAAMLAGGESGTAVVLNKPEQSLLIRAIEYDELQMPPNGKLAEAEIKLFQDWIARGAPWPETKEGASGIRTPGAITPADRQFWSFQPIRAQPQPAVRDATWPREGLDTFILARLEAEKLAPVAEAEEQSLLRRATFDLTGLPPTIDEAEAFAGDESPDAYERLLDRLLASPRYGERWARHWLDVARYAEDQAHTFQARQYPSGYRYRDYVIDSLNADLPYDRFVQEQIAGDLLEGEDAARRLPALGFFALGPVYYADAGCAPKAIADELDDRVDTLSRGLLGLTVSCARCHDHKFDPVTMRDYYALAGVFASSKYLEAPLAPTEVVAKYDEAVARVKEQEKTLADVQKDVSRETRQTLSAQTSQYILAAWKLQNRRKTKSNTSAGAIANKEKLHDFAVEAWAKFLSADNLAKKPYLQDLKAVLDGQDAKADLSEDAAALTAAKQATDELQSQVVAANTAKQELEAKYAADLAAAAPESKDKIAKPALDKSQAELLKDLVEDAKGPFAIPNDKLDKVAVGENHQRIAAAKKELEERKKAVGPKYPFAHSLTEGEPKNLKLHLRGDHKTLGDEAPRRFLEVLTSGAPTLFTQGSGRRELAQQIASDENPLTARVIVNRIWQHTFGRGLVGTPSNLGMLGERPTHPELLDDLASRFLAHGWSRKWLLRQLMASAVYRLSSDGAPKQFERDPDNRLLWRMNRRRLDIEAWRDAALASAGNLDLALGGPSIDLNSSGNRRRTLYAVVSRHNLNATLRLFDFPDPNLTSERRISTTVPMQQLFVMNSEFTIREAKSLAERVQREVTSDDATRIELAYRLLLARSPTESERKLGVEFLQAATMSPDVKLTPWERYAQALLASNEFAFVD